jgi:hypothetical protein
MNNDIFQHISHYLSKNSTKKLEVLYALLHTVVILQIYNETYLCNIFLYKNIMFQIIL